MRCALDVEHTALAAVNDGSWTSATSWRPLVETAEDESASVFVVSATRLYVLDPTSLAPTASISLGDEDEDGSAAAVTCHSLLPKVAVATRTGQVTVWQNSGSQWRIHSQLSANRHTSTVHWTADTLVLAGDDGWAIYTLDERTLLPLWTLSHSHTTDAPILHARLTPSASMLATATQGSCLVRVLAVLPGPTPKQRRIRFRSHAIHSLRVRNVEWRPSDNPADSGPILFTQTEDGVFRIWGCMIDEPDFFSLWATLDLHDLWPTAVPVLTSWIDSTLSNSRDEQERRATSGNTDKFITFLSDGSAYETRVHNFDSRPPACLKQITRRINVAPLDKPTMQHLRHANVLTFEDNRVTLLGRSAVGSLATVSVPLEVKTTGEEKARVWTAACNHLGPIKQLVPSIDGGNVLALGQGQLVQSWQVGEDQVITQSLLSDASLKVSSHVVAWNEGRCVASLGTLGVKVFEFRQSGKFHDVASCDDTLPPITMAFAFRSSSDAPTTTLVAVTENFMLMSWTYNATTKMIDSISEPQSLNEDRPRERPLVACCAIPALEADTVNEQARIMVIDSVGTATVWTADILEDDHTWFEGAHFATGRSNPTMIATNAGLTSAIACRTADGAYELSIWDALSSEFSSGLQYSWVERSELIDLDWSTDGSVLAVTKPDRIDLLCAQRLSDSHLSASFTTLAAFTPAPSLNLSISQTEWVDSGLVVACGSDVFFVSLNLANGRTCQQLAAEQRVPLPYHHPQFLMQALLHGHVGTVLNILESIASQLTVDGDVTPIRNERMRDRISVHDFVRAQNHKKQARQPLNVISQLTSESTSSRTVTALSEDKMHRLSSALDKNLLVGLSKDEHAQLSVVASTAFEIQRQRISLDENGLRYLVSMRAHWAARAKQSEEEANSADNAAFRYRAATWAFFSEHQDVLLDECNRMCDAQLDWNTAKAFGLVLWLKNRESLSRQLEVIGRNEFNSGEDREPIFASLLYLAVRKKHLVLTFWKQSTGHADQKPMLRFLSNDFAEARWRSAALKNAYALMSKRRFLFAAAFFLLGDSLKDAVNVCVRQLGDIELAITIARAYEGDDGPGFQTLLHDVVVPRAFATGSRWLAIWAFWLLGRRDLAVRVTISPLASLAAEVAPPFDVEIASHAYEDPSLVYMFSQLRSWSLQTVKGAVAVSGQTEFKFVLHAARSLRRMGCHTLALALVATYQFSATLGALSSSKKSINGQVSDAGATAVFDRRKATLRRRSTLLDMEVPSNLASRAPSPTFASSHDNSMTDKDASTSLSNQQLSTNDSQAKNEFHQVLRKVKVETKAPPEFDMNAFNF
ncbi:hypothetical protein ACM66B_003147 [Microbotryomycetes sp. NB124-2]